MNQEEGKLAENWAEALKMMNLMEVEEHSHWGEENSQFVVEIPLVLVVLVAVAGKKLVELIVD